MGRARRKRTRRPKKPNAPPIALPPLALPPHAPYPVPPPPPKASDDLLIALIGTGLFGLLQATGQTDLWYASPIALILLGLGVSGWASGVQRIGGRPVTPLVRRSIKLLSLLIVVIWGGRILWSAWNPPKADLTVRFVQGAREQPLLVFGNQGDRLATGVLINQALWRRDDTEQPLQFPARGVDWIRPHSEFLPHPFLPADLPASERVMGTVAIQCSDCDAGKTYVVSFGPGPDDWFAEWPAGGGQIHIPTDFKDFESFFRTLEAAAPFSARRPFTEK